MPSGILGISAMGLSAAQAGIRTTQHNIANVNTAGYHRQTTSYVSALSQLSEAGAFGTGARSAGVSRAYDRFLESQVTFNQGQLSRHQIYAGYASQLDSMLGASGNGLTEALGEFFASVNEVANDPTSMAARQTMLSSGSILTRRIGDLDNMLDSIRKTINQQVQDIAQQVTNYASRIAAINSQISNTQATADDYAINDLLDQRDYLAGEINKLVGATAVVQGDGAYNLFIGSGQPLVSGGFANAMVAVADPSDSSLMLPALRIGGADVTLTGDQITAGQLGGLLNFREDMLVPTQRELGTLTYALVNRFNAAHSAGFGLDGVTTGLNFFSTPSLRDPVPSGGNTGTGAFTVAITDVNQLANSDYTLSFDGANYTLTRQSDGATFVGADPSTDFVAQGFSFTLTGAPAANDSFLVRPTQYSAHGLTVAISDPSAIAASLTGAPGDNQNALTLAAVQTEALLGNSVNTLQAAYSQLVSRNATLASGADINLKAYETLTTQSTEAQLSFSGVNLDEEAANLIQYQQAYQAAAKAMQIASTLLEELLSIGR